MISRLLVSTAIAFASTATLNAQMNNHGSMGGSMMGGSTGGSAADQDAFASVYDLLDQDLATRRETGMLYGDPSNSLAGSGQFDAGSAQTEPNFPSQNAAPQDFPPQDFPPQGGQQQDGFPEDPFAGAFEQQPPALPSPPAQTAAPLPLPPSNIDNPFGSDPFDSGPASASSSLSIDQELGLDDDLASLPDLDDEEFEANANPGLLGGLLGNIYIGAYGAATYTQPNSFDEAVTGYDSKSIPAYGGGAVAGTKLGPINIEAEAHYSQTVTEVENSTVAGLVPDGTTVTRTNLVGLANAYYQLKFGSFGAFAGGSVGYGQFKSQQDNEALDPQPDELTAQGLVYGPLAGLTYAFGDKIELAAQYRYLLSGDLEYSNEDGSVSSENKITDHQAMIAVRYKF